MKFYLIYVTCSFMLMKSCQNRIEPCLYMHKVVYIKVSIGIRKEKMTQVEYTDKYDTRSLVIFAYTWVALFFAFTLNRIE